LIALWEVPWCGQSLTAAWNEPDAVWKYWQHSESAQLAQAQLAVQLKAAMLCVLAADCV